MCIDLAGRKVLVVGLGRSGIAAARLCRERGAKLTVTDSRPADKLAPAIGSLGSDVRAELGGHDQETFEQSDLIVLSPGVPPIPQLRAAEASGVPIIGEIELASRFVEAPILAITGTNGKSTTTSLAGEIFVAAGVDTFCGGNLGRPLAEAVLDGDAGLKASGRVVLELSSFQLETVSQFSAQVAMLLNLTEDHLDRYPDFAAYRAAKARIFERQGDGDFAVVNSDQPDCVALSQRSSAPLLGFASTPPAEGDDGAWLDDASLHLRLPGKPQERYERSTLRLAGKHNAQNALAALLGCRLAGAPIAACKAALSSFGGLPHRMERVGEVDGVGFFNDSKATNVGSVVGSLTGFERPVVLIAGGKDKGGDYAPLIPVLREVCRHVVLIGAAADKIADALQDTLPLHRASTLPDAVKLGSELAHSGDAVVLSPACSSYDMFDNFEQRGQVFADAVDRLRRS